MVSIFSIYEITLKKGGPLYVYRAEIEAIQPTLQLTIPEVVRYESVTLSVPQGNRMAVMVNASRGNFRSPLKMELKDAPQGLTHQPAEMAENSNTVPMLFEAAPDAPLNGTYADLTGTPTTEKYQAITGHLYQRSLLVRGRNTC